MIITIKNTINQILIGSICSLIVGCGSVSNEVTNKTSQVKARYPSDVIENLSDWKILLGNGESSDSLIGFAHDQYFFTAKDEVDWVVYKTPNQGITSRTSHNTRTELGQKKYWTPMKGSKLSGTLKVMHVSTSGDARVAASYSVVVGQIHSDEGHENEPLKIFYKKFPGHSKGSVFWNYEINTSGDNSGRWDYSTAVWGYDMAVIGSSPDDYPNEPVNGIELGEEFSYEVNVHKGIMYLTFESESHETKAFIKSLVQSEYSTKEKMPQQIVDLYSVIGRDGTEMPKAYEGELQYFKQGAYNQSNGGSPDENMVWSTGSATYEGDVKLQYANGSYAEVWFRKSKIGIGTDPMK